MCPVCRTVYTVKRTVSPTVKQLCKDEKVAATNKRVRAVREMLGVTASIILQHFCFQAVSWLLLC